MSVITRNIYRYFKEKESNIVMSTINEFILEQSTLEWFKELNYQYKNGGDIAPGEPEAERDEYSEVLLKQRLLNAMNRLNPDIPETAIQEAYKKVSFPDSPSLEINNRAFHRMLVDGVSVEYKAKDGRIKGDRVRLIDFENPDNNDWLVVNQFTVVEGNHNRRPDVVVFLNGIPLAVIELKNPTDEKTTIKNAFYQLQTYKKQIPSLFTYNELLIISDGMEARAGSLTADFERFMPWKTIDGEETASNTILKLKVLLLGIFEKERFLDYLKYFITFEDDGSKIVKKTAAYHQFHAVRKAVEHTVTATGITGDKRCGVIWHTQGSGKSLTMVFYAGKIILHPSMRNPTIIVITDRNDLDNQLFGTFATNSELVRQKPLQIVSREDLRNELNVASGGVFFTTIQKFMPEKSEDSFPELSDRRNIVVIADEAHRSQYDFLDGFARHLRDALPNASFIGFTGTPIELTDKVTTAVFGDYISVYDIQQAVEDGATVPIYYESRLAKLELDPTEIPHLDADFEEATEGEELEKKEKLKTKWAALEALVGSEKRLQLIAEDIIKHFDSRLEVMDGKAMIVCMSRRICVELYEALIRIRPEWHGYTDDSGEVKVVMTGSASDPPAYTQHIRKKQARKTIEKRFKDSKDPLKIVIVRDMWLTGFDVPCLHTMYVDKPMQGHGLMQAIARVNRVYKDKPGGLIVDYIGLAHQLKKALANYTQSGGKGMTAKDQEDAVGIMMEKYEICRGMFHEFDYSGYLSGVPAEKLNILPAAQEHILSQDKGKDRFIKAVEELSKAFALSVPNKKTIEIRDEIIFFQEVKSVLKKTISPSSKTNEELDFAVRQLVSKAVSSDRVIDIFAAAGLNKPELSILSDEFLEEVRDIPHKNLAVELLQKLLNDQIKVIQKKFLIQARSFAELLQTSINKYQNRAIETVQIIDELIQLAKDIKQAQHRGEELGLNEDELAFYDALEVNDSAVSVLGDDTLKKIARELVEIVRNNTKIDWTIRENVQANLRRLVKRILRKYGYPPDKQEKATETVLKQAEMLSECWVG